MKNNRTPSSKLPRVHVKTKCLCGRPLTATVTLGDPATFVPDHVCARQAGELWASVCRSIITAARDEAKKAVAKKKTKKPVFVVGNTDSALFNVATGKRCQKLRGYWFNGEGWYQLRDAAGNVFNSPDIFWDKPSAKKGAAAAV